MKILKIAAKDLPLFNGICEIDFLPQQRVNSENAENMSELFSTPSNTFYKNNVIVMYITLIFKLIKLYIIICCQFIMSGLNL